MTHIFVIPDTQCKPGVSIDHVIAAGKEVVATRPDYIVFLGDHWDFPSLCSHDQGKKDFNCRRLVEDIQAGQQAMKAFLSPLQNLQINQKQNKRKIYLPVCFFIKGNHEARLSRFFNENPRLEGLASIDSFLEDLGFNVVPYLDRCEIEGINFTHNLVGEFTGKPLSGLAKNQLDKAGCSFVVGHKQTLDIAYKQTIDGRMLMGIVAGASYTHYEEYKGPMTNNHWRGFIHLRNAKDGYADIEIISTTNLIAKHNGGLA